TTQHHGCSHLPIPADLPQPGVFLAAKAAGNGKDILRARGPEVPEPGPRFTHFGFAPKIVKLHNQLRICCGCFAGHSVSPSATLLVQFLICSSANSAHFSAASAF